jgi:aspartate aminotransferase
LALKSYVVFDFLERTLLTGKQVSLILNDKELRAQWFKDLGVMSSRMITARQALYDALQDLKTPGKWEHILTQKGMFS